MYASFKYLRITYIFLMNSQQLESINKLCTYAVTLHNVELCNVELCNVELCNVEW